MLFTPAQRKEIARAIERLILETKNPLLPKNPRFRLYVEGMSHKDWCHITHGDLE